MPLFQRTRFVWYEPWFFQQRIRTAKGWIVFSLLLLVVAAGAGAALFFAAPPGLNLLQIIGLSLGLAAAVWWVLDGTNTRRQALLLDDSIVVGGDMGKYSTAETYKLPKIAAAAIVLPGESNWPEPALFFLYDGQEQGIGIEAKVSLKRLAQAIHDAGVPIRLEGWQPNQESELARSFSWRADPADVTERAQLEPLAPGTPSLVSPTALWASIVCQCWALGLALSVVAAAAYNGYLHWNNLSIVQFVLLIVVSLAALLLAGEFTERVALAAASRGLVRSGRKQIRLREGLAIDPEGELIPVEVLVRDQFEKTIQRIREMGFLQADSAGRRMLFEGKEERWSIPAASIRSLALEEVQTGTPGQSAMGRSSTTSWSRSPLRRTWNSDSASASATMASSTT